jgi:hypothetical protein
MRQVLEVMDRNDRVPDSDEQDGEDRIIQKQRKVSR